MDQCPVCKNVEGGVCRVRSIGLPTQLACGICGNYSVRAELAFQIRDGATDVGHWELTPLQRAVLSHRIRTRSTKPLTAEDEFLVTTEALGRLRAEAKLPSPAVQAMNLVRFIGDTESGSGRPVSEFPVELHAIVGAFDREKAIQLAEELAEQGIVRTHGQPTYSRLNQPVPLKEPTEITLSLDGWERYEAEKRGRLSGQDGFLAMPFNDPDLEEFVSDMLKPAVETNLGCQLHDMRDVSRAGLIDNIMRVQIRDARFVIAELTHENRGAYWEAGFAEGLGKPVIYVCERTKFDRYKTHFDTNHCTTVTWSAEDHEEFKRELVATLRRSLDEQE